MTHRPLQRLRPKLPTGSYTTYSIRQPLNTHFRIATCEEVDCWAWRNGWRIRVEGTLPADLHAAQHSGRAWRHVRVDATESYLVYEAGQRCFTTHRVNLDRPAFFLMGRGDYRSFNPRQAKLYTDEDEWVETFSCHLDELHERLNKG